MVSLLLILTDDHALIWISCNVQRVTDYPSWITLPGSANQKGTVMGILRSLGALARALGPVVSSSGEEAVTTREKTLILDTCSFSELN